MSLPHALLGLLAVAPATGYELTREFERELGRYAWQAGHASIYPELAKLAGRGLVEVVGEGARGSKTYDVTAKGRAELRDWLLRPLGGGVVRNEAVLRMFLIPALDVDDQRTMLSAIAEESVVGEGELRERLNQQVESDRLRRAEMGLPAARFGLGQYRATREWARRELDELERRDKGD